MAVLLLADVNGGQLALDSVAKALTAVKPLGEVHLLVAGPASAAAEAAQLEGASKVLHADGSGHGLAEGLADLVVSLAGFYSHIAGAATAFSRNVLPRAAALLDVMMISDVTSVVDPETFERPIYAGNALQTVRSSDKVKVFTVRTAAFAATGSAGKTSVEIIGDTLPELSSWIEDRVAASDRPELTSAKIVVLSCCRFRGQRVKLA